MKTLSLFTILLTVNFFITGVAWGQTLEDAKNARTKEDCETITAELAESKCNKNPSGCDLTKEDNNFARQAQCSLKPSLSNTSNRCSSLEDKIESAREKAIEECQRTKEKGTNAQCLVRASECSKEDDYTSDGFDITQAAQTLVGLTSALKGQQNGQLQLQRQNPVKAECVVDDDEKEESSAERMAEKRQRLLEEIADLRKDMTEEDNKLNEKKEKVVEEIQKLQEDIDKAKTDRQKDDQDKAANIAKQTLSAQKAQTKALLDIEEKNRQINQVKLSVQSKVLLYSDQNLLLACRSQIETKKKELITANKGKGLKGTKEVQVSLQAFADTCISKAKSDRRQELQSLQDRIAQFNSDIAQKNDDIKGAKQTIAQEQSNMEALKKISDDAEKKEAEMFTAKSNRLNQSVLDLENHIKQKKITVEEKINAKNAAIYELDLKKINKKPKYGSVIKASGKVDNLISQYQVNESCCPKDDKGKLTPSARNNDLCSEDTAKKLSPPRTRSGNTR